MKKFAYPIILLGGTFAMSLLSGHAQTAREIGIDRSNLTRESEAVQEKTLQDIRALHATWFRDVFVTVTPQDTDRFINELRLAKQNQLKFLANVLPAKADYDAGYQNQNAGEDFRKRCGWPQGSPRVSQVNVAKFTQRFRSQLEAVRAANLTIDAFEIGNEYDWICFNGDVPDGHTPTQEELMTAVRGYAHLLKAAAEVIRDPQCFPNAKIITFGMAHGSDRWDKPPHQHHFSNPARMVAMLRNLDGFNYLDNAIYHVDGYGTHIYPDTDSLEQSVTDLVRQDAAILGPDKPLWVTEWGLDAKKYPNKQRQARAEGIRNFYATLDKLGLRFGPPFYYCYSPGGGKGLTDANGTLLPEARAVSQASADRDVIVGVNTVGVERMNEQQQDAFVELLRQNGVNTVRLGIDEKYNHFIIRAYQRGIGVVAVVFPWLGSKNARMRPSDLSVDLVWGQAAFSTIDPKDFRAWFDSRLAALEAGGVRLTAFELGNEINTAGYDGDFSASASGRVLSLSDLNNPDDKEAAPIASGYRVYLKALAELKQARDGSKLNKTTPIISAGLADDGPPGKRPGKKVDGVSLPATLEFLRQNDMDNLVDGYGVHFYPSNPDPNTPVSERINGLSERAFALCTAAKPCWLTEWGFANNDLSCPIHDEKRVKLFQTERSAFETFVRQGRLAAIIYYNWMSKPGYEAPSIFRCGALTDAGKLALSPM